MNLHQIETLVAIADCGSYRRAAERLGRNQPALSKTILAMEDGLGLTLFHRSQRGATLTEAGEALYRRARTVMADLAAMTDEATHLLGLRQGRVRVGVSPAAATAILPRALALFRQSWPEVEVDVIPALFPDSGNHLREAALDLAIGPAPGGGSAHDLVVETLFDMPAMVVTSRSNPRRNARTLRDLQDAPWLVHGPAEGPSSLFSQAFAGNIAFAPKAFTRSHSISATMSLIEETGAFCVLSGLVYEALNGKYALASVPITDPLPMFRMAQITHRAHPPTPATLAFSACVRRRAQAIRAKPAPRA